MKPKVLYWYGQWSVSYAGYQPRPFANWHCALRFALRMKENGY